MKKIALIILSVFALTSYSKADDIFYIGAGYSVTTDDKFTDATEDFDEVTSIPIGIDLGYYFGITDMVAIGPVISQRFNAVHYKQTIGFGGFSTTVDGGILASHTLVGASGLIYPFGDELGEGLFGRADLGIGLANYFDISSDNVEDDDPNSAMSEASAVGVGANIGAGYSLPIGNTLALDFSVVYSIFPITVEDEVLGNTVEVSEGANYLTLMVGFKF